MKKRNPSKTALTGTGLLGGLFDPVHNGHLRLARAALCRLRLRRLIVVPAHTPWHKKAPVLSAPDRLRLAREAFSRIRNVRVSDMEIRRGGVSYTWQTLERLRKRFGKELYLIIGADNIGEIRKWKRPDKIFGLAKTAVAARPPFRPLSACPGHGGKMLPLPLNPLKVSSSELRRLLKAGKDASAWIPRKVLKIILEKGWYR